MRRAILLVVMCVGMFFVLLDVTIVNVALPAMRAHLGLGASGLEWVVDADTLGFACLMLVAGTIGDRTGRKRLVLVGLVAVGLGSAVCALAQGLGVLLLGRALQGVGGALLLPQTLAVIATAYPERREQAKAIGIWAGVSSLALPAGPLVGGVLVDRFGWPAVFWVNVPVVVVATAVAAWAVPNPPCHAGRHFDVAGQLLALLGLAALTAGLIEVSGRSWTALPVVVLVVVGIVMLGGFAWWERRASHPMLPVVLLGDRRFVGPNVVGLLMNFGGVGLLYLATLFLQVSQHRSALDAGLYLLAPTLPLAVLAPIAGRIAARVGWRLPMALGLIAAAAAGILMGLFAGSSGLWLVVPVLGLLGVGLALNTAPMVGAVMAAAPKEWSSLASATNNTARQVGSALGVAVLGAVAGDPGSKGFVTGLHHAGLVGAAGWLLAAAIAAVSLRPMVTSPRGSHERGPVRGLREPTVEPALTDAMASSRDELPAVAEGHAEVRGEALDPSRR